MLAIFSVMVVKSFLHEVVTYDYDFCNPVMITEIEWSLHADRNFIVHHIMAVALFAWTSQNL